MKIRRTRTHTVQAATAAALDAAYLAWAETMEEAELVSDHCIAVGTDLVLVIVYTGGPE